MNQLRINIADCSYGMLEKAAKRCGFLVKGGRKHCKIITQEGKFVTEIPRKNRLKRETARGVVNAMSKHGCDIIHS